MRFMVIVKATAESEKEGALPDAQVMADMGKYNEELIKAGILLALDGLHPSQRRTRQILRQVPYGRRRPLHRGQGARRRLLDLAGQVPRRPSSGSSVAPTLTPATPKSKSARSLRWKNSHPSSPTKSYRTKNASAPN
jgi:hypothetical protein